MGSCSAYVGLRWPYLGPMLALCCPMLAPCWPMLALCWPCLGPMLALCCPMLAYVGPMLAYVGPMLAHLGAYVDASSAVFWAIFVAAYVEAPSRGQLFRFFPLPGAQNHVKTTVFEHRQDKIRGRRRARNTVKREVFLTPRAKSIVNYRVIS